LPFNVSLRFYFLPKEPQPAGNKANILKYIAKRLRPEQIYPDKRRSFYRDKFFPAAGKKYLNFVFDLFVARFAYKKT